MNDEQILERIVFSLGELAKNPSIAHVFNGKNIAILTHLLKDDTVQRTLWTISQQVGVRIYCMEGYDNEYKIVWWGCEPDS